MSSDPPAYEPPGPEITGGESTSRAVPEGNNGGDTFKDEPAAGEYSDEGDPVKWNFSPTTIIILVILNLLAAGALGYLIWYAVDQATNTPAPTPSPTIATPSPSMAPSRSFRPSLTPSVSSFPSILPSDMPSIDSTPAPTTSNQPTPIASSSPTFGPFTCSLCGEGNTMSTTNLSGEISFGSRVTRTCQELLDDQNNGDILEEQCIELYDDILATCGCDSTATIGARDDAGITAIIQAAGIDTTGTNEASALTDLLSATTDTYFASEKATMTDPQVVERYIMILAHKQLKLQSLLSSELPFEVCFWQTAFTCEYGRVTWVYFDGVFEVATGTPAFPVDLFRLEASRITVVNYSLASTIPASIPQTDLLTNLELYANSLTGTLPDALFELRSLTTLDLSNNGLSGNIGDKTKIKQLIRLDNLDLGNNAFTGTMPTCELSTTPATFISDCASEVTCTCCSSCADTTTGTV
ncbi:unnamed protein product [Cylindrotheca closterium]|uniref:L domain-like protein n=1 Tax=Cylindrotheca closterium TaxID=2856 RepID=A0AAD2FZ21_9STRA|nr:unnamed protein product [Cylindrotheca closterium]